VDFFRSRPREWEGTKKSLILLRKQESTDISISTKKKKRGDGRLPAAISEGKYRLRNCGGGLTPLERAGEKAGGYTPKSRVRKKKGNAKTIACWFWLVLQQSTSQKEFTNGKMIMVPKRGRKARKHRLSHRQRRQRATHVEVEGTK